MRRWPAFFADSRSPFPTMKPLVLGLLASFALSLQAAQFSVEKTASGGAIVKLDGEFLTELVVDQANKTYLWPIIGTQGVTMTRAYPMKEVAGEQHDHPHHRGLCFGHENIGGYDTWAEAASFGKAPKSSERMKHLGSIKLRQITRMEGGERASLRTESDYLDAQGNKTCSEVREYVFGLRANGQRFIDVDVVIIASEADTLVDDKKDAGLSIRVPTEMAVDRGKEGGRGTGHIISSEGLRDEEAWGKRAKWVDYYGTVGGKAVGVAMLNHPKSFQHPTPWHVRTYGLFTANPFGLSQLKLQDKSAAFTLKKGERLTLRHRFVFHDGDEKAADIAGAYEEYAKQP